MTDEKESGQQSSLTLMERLAEVERHGFRLVGWYVAQDVYDALLAEAKIEKCKPPIGFVGSLLRIGELSIVVEPWMSPGHIAPMLEHGRLRTLPFTIPMPESREEIV